MKTKVILCFLFFGLCGGTLQSQESATIELPITMHTGYGPFLPSFRGISTRKVSDANPWRDTSKDAKNIPETWTEVGEGKIETDIYQAAYQDYISGTASKESYENLQKSWNWTPDTASLSKKPVKTKIAFAIGKDASGELKLIVDANNNLDYSDDVPFTPLSMHELLGGQAMDKAIEVSCEYYLNGEIVARKIPMMIGHYSNMYMCNFPLYATTELDGQQIALCSSRFSDLSWRETNALLVHPGDSLPPNVIMDRIVANNEYIEVNGALYKNKGVNASRNVLVLEKTTAPRDQLYATQIGFRPPAFAGEDFLTKAGLSLEDHKGKYVLIDFWSTSCGPCIQEMPNLKALYERTDPSRFEIIGIVGDSRPTNLSKAIEKHSITWPQILSDEENNITKAYGVNSYPTVFLVDPNGVIVAKNLRGKALDDKVEEALRSSPPPSPTAL